MFRADQGPPPAQFQGCPRIYSILHIDTCGTVYTFLTYHLHLVHDMNNDEAGRNFTATEYSVIDLSTFGETATTEVTSVNRSLKKEGEWSIGFQDAQKKKQELVMRTVDRDVEAWVRRFL